MEEKWNTGESLRRAEFIASFIDSKGKLLDIGGYKGEVKRFLPRSIEYHIIDLYKNRFKNSKQFDLNKKYLPYPDDSFDYIICAGTLEHCLYPREILKEIHRIMKPKAIAIISIPNDEAIPIRIIRAIQKQAPIDIQHFSHHWFFSLETAREFLEKHFNIIEENGYMGLVMNSFIPFSLLKIIPSLIPEMFFKVIKK